MFLTIFIPIETLIGIFPVIIGVTNLILFKLFSNKRQDPQNTTPLLLEYTSHERYASSPFNIFL